MKQFKRHRRLVKALSPQCFRKLKVSSFHCPCPAKQWSLMAEQLAVHQKKKVRSKGRWVCFMVSPGTKENVLERKRK